MPINYRRRDNNNEKRTRNTQKACEENRIKLSLKLIDLIWCGDFYEMNGVHVQ